MKWISKANDCEKDFILLAGDGTFKRIHECKTGRVYCFSFCSTELKLYIWLQEPENKDFEIEKRVASILNFENEDFTDEEKELKRIKAEGERSIISKDLLRKALANVTSQKETTFSELLKPERTLKLLENESYVKDLVKHVPEGNNRDSDEVAACLRSPQFANVVHAFDRALKKGQIKDLLIQLGVDVGDEPIHTVEDVLRLFRK